MSVVEKLYTYLKDKYGMSETEVLDSDKTQPKKITILIPGVRKNSEKHQWLAIIEIGSGNKVSLIIGEEWPSDNNSWSRYIEIEDHQDKHYSYPFLKIIQNLHFFKDFDFKTLKIFLGIFEYFLKTTT